MNFKIDVECSPEEARLFIGLPNVVPMQEAMMKELEAIMLDNIRNLDPETLVKTWFPATIQNWSDMQKTFWGQMGMGGMAPSPEKQSAGAGKSKK